MKSKAIQLLPTSMQQKNSLKKDLHKLLGGEVFKEVFVHQKKALFYCLAILILAKSLDITMAGQIAYFLYFGSGQDQE